jgi:hypothetical protein
MLRILLFVPLAALAQTDSGAATPLAVDHHLTLGQRAGMYAEATIGPVSFLSAAVSAGFNQWRDAPPEWGQGGAGFGRRFGGRMAVNATGNAVEFGASALLGEDTRYFPSGRKGVADRTSYALIRTFVAPHEDGHRTIAASRFIGAYGSAFLANTWYPDRVSNTRGALLRGTWSILSDAGNNVFKEFWPDLKRKLFRRRS